VTLWVSQKAVYSNWGEADKRIFEILKERLEIKKQIEIG